MQHSKQLSCQGCCTFKHSCTASGYLTRDLTVLSRDFAVTTKSDFKANRRPQNKFNTDPAYLCASNYRTQ